MILDKLIAGDTWSWTVEVPDYPASDTWVLKYQLTPRFSTPTQAVVTLTATTNADGERYDIDIAPATTAIEPGDYSWSRWVEKAGARQTLDVDKRLTVIPNPALAVQGYDYRSNARKALDNIEAFIAGDRSVGVAGYTYKDRQLQYWPAADLAAELSRLRWEVERENEADRIAKGLPGKRPIRVRFGAKGM